MKIRRQVSQAGIEIGDPLPLILLVWLAIAAGTGANFRNRSGLAIKPQALASLTHYSLTGHCDTYR